MIAEDRADTIRKLDSEVEKLTAERDELRRDLAIARNDFARSDSGKLRAERDELRATIARVRELCDNLEAGGCASCSSITGGDMLATEIRAALDGEAQS